MEHVKQTNDNIKFNKVVSSEKDLSYGIHYDLTIDASNSKGKNGKYQAEVFQMSWEDKLSLSCPLVQLTHLDRVEAIILDNNVKNQGAIMHVISLV
ncbi:hypothetical protein HU200_054756 [Digitaria exilis]|uniref:Cystatin domain-containing protein n=1 Tax=Digitaria exilis TaxID=1010633 RepID=A0A835AMH5_9POAL|nr:hypothetical protein HU200_054756 [Digitaria exilis]